MTNTKQTTTGDLLETIKNHLIGVYSLEPEQVNEMLRLSSTILIESLKEARVALSDDNKADLSALAHKIKGVLLGAGLKQQADLALIIESGAREGKEEPYQQLLDDLQESVLPLLQFVAE